jgi:poly(3-hydroxybutyrate) depolymerase
VKRATYGGCANGVSVVLFTIDGGEHKWPVGPEPGKKENDGQSRDVDAMLTTWQLAFGAK